MGSQNQSENILTKLQNLLVAKRSEPEIPRVRKSKGTLQASSGNRKQAHSIGSLGYS